MPTFIHCFFSFKSDMEYFLGEEICVHLVTSLQLAGNGLISE